MLQIIRTVFLSLEKYDRSFPLFFCSERFEVSNQLMKSCIEKPGVLQSQPPSSRGNKCHSSGSRFIKKSLSKLILLRIIPLGHEQFLL